MDTDEEEEVQIEEPINELKTLLEELVATHHSHPAGDGSTATASEVLPLLSKVSLKIEEIMKGFDSQFKDAKHVVFDRRLYDEKLLSSQVCKCCIVNVLCHCAEEWSELFLLLFR